MQPEEIPAELLGKYGETVVEIFLDGKTLAYQELYAIWQRDFYMITAANPYSQLLSDEENKARNQSLHVELTKISELILSAIGRDPTSDWSEHGWVLPTSDEKLLIDLARKFHQNAIFKFSESGKQVIDCL
jgi:hypothetical protein